ncbi:hypothetical protein RB195_023095 [Necator americanus]|uniref:Uncharacterized protein n=1 Tax=Necator americanus TaxID=51031 RepID=A0ABR1EI19_NECAM
MYQMFNEVPVVDPNRQRSHCESAYALALSTVMKKLDCISRKLLCWMLGCFWAMVCYNEELYSEMDMVFRRMMRGKQRLAAPSKIAEENCLHFLGHIIWRPSDCVIQVVFRMLPDSN